MLYFTQCATDASAQVAADSLQSLTADQPSANLPAQIPDSLCVNIEGEALCFPTGDGQAAGEIIKGFVEKNKGQWPDDVLGWILLLGGFLLSARGTALLSNATRIYYFLRGILKKTLHVVAFVAGVFSAGITFLFGTFTGKGFDIAVFVTLWPVVSFGAVYIYENWIKKDDFIDPETVKAEPANA